MQNITITAVVFERALRVISFIIIISGFLIINEAWSDSEKETLTLDAQYDLGWVFINEGKINLAHSWWQKVAAQGHMKNAQYYDLGWGFIGKGTEDLAYFWWKKAADQGHMKAQYMLGRLFLFMSGAGWYNWWVRADDHIYRVMNLCEMDIKAKYWLEQAANQGHMDAQFSLGWIMIFKETKDQAKYWLEQAANQGHVSAQFWLGVIIANEEEDEQANKYNFPLDKHGAKSEFYLEKLAFQGNMEAQWVLGQIFFKEGEIEQAKFWWEKAADKGSESARRKLGALKELELECDSLDSKKCSEFSKNVIVQIEQNKSWWEDAAKQSRSAKRKLEALKELEFEIWKDLVFSIPLSSEWASPECTIMIGSDWRAELTRLLVYKRAQKSMIPVLNFIIGLEVKIRNEFHSALRR